MKRKITTLILLILTIGIVTGCEKTKEEPQEIKKEKMEVTYNEMATMEKISKQVFNGEKDNLKVEDLDDAAKSEIARNLPDNGYLDKSGSELTKLFQKYFGANQTITFEDVKCQVDHHSEEENYIYHYDKEQDKYVYNEKHPGHGGGGVEFIGKEIELEKLEVIGDEYIYSAKFLFYGPALCHDVGSCDYGKAYGSYKDAKNQTNPLLEIDNNPKYAIFTGDLPIINFKEILKDTKEKLDTYQFKFVKEDGQLIFKEYKK